MLASGTRNAREIPGFRRGSSRSASATGDLLAVDAGLPRSPRRSGRRRRDRPTASSRTARRCPRCSRRRRAAGSGSRRCTPRARERVLDDIAPARVQQPVEAAAGALGQVVAVDEDRRRARAARRPRRRRRRSRRRRSRARRCSASPSASAYRRDRLGPVGVASWPTPPHARLDGATRPSRTSA